MTDNNQIKVLDTFSGIGGFSLGLEAAGNFKTVAFSEIEPAASYWLNRHWPEVPNLGDITQLNGNKLISRFGNIDLICGGFPCQDVSVAGKQRGLGTKEAPTRSGLFFQLARLISEVRPRWLLLENVAALKSNGYDGVHDELERIGYTCWPTVVSAENLGAPHKRQRVWIVGLDKTVADSAASRLQERLESAGWQDSEEAGAGLEPKPERRSEVLADSRLRPRASGASKEKPVPASRNCTRWPSRPGEQQYEWEAPRLATPEPCMGLSAHGLPAEFLARGVVSAAAIRREQLKAMGNSIVPQIACLWGQVIIGMDAIIRRNK